MTACRCAVAAMLQRRCVGYVARHGSAGAGKRIEKPCDVARYIEKVAKELGADRRQKERGNCKELVDAMCANITQYTAMEVRAVAHGMPLIFGRDVDGAWLQTIATFTLKRAYMMPVYLLYPIVNSLARMTKDASGLPMDQLLQACRERVEEANSIDLATMAQTATLLRRTPVVEGVMQDVANRAVTEEILGEISATNAVLILYAFAQMGIKHEKMYPTLKQVIKKMDHDDFQPHLIPIALHALARFGSRDRPVLETVANHAVKVTHEMQPENVSGTVCALAKLKFRHSLLLREMAKRTRQLMDDVNVREMSNIFWGFAKLRHDDGALVDAMIDRCVEYPHIDNMSFAQMFEAIRCYHAVHRADAIRTLLRRYLMVMPQCSTQIVTQVAWCCCSLGHNDDGIIAKSLEELQGRKRSRVEQKYVEMLLEAVKASQMAPEEQLTHYIEALGSLGR